MTTIILIISVAVILIYGYKYFSPNRKNQFQEFNNQSSKREEKLHYVQEERSEYERTTSKEKGDNFEKFVIKLFDFESKRFLLKEWRSDKYYDGIYPASNHYPDFEIELKTKSYISLFAVECKYRSIWGEHNIISWATEQQIINYDNYKIQKSSPVFIVLGVGGKSNSPKEVYVFSLEDVNYQPTINYNQVQCFRKENIHAKLFYNAEFNSLQ